METILDIDGMTCSGCARTVREALAGIEGIERAEVDLEAKTAVVAWAEAPEAPPTGGRGGEIEARVKARSRAEERERTARLVAAVRAAGYGARPRREREPGESGRVDLDPVEKTGSLWSAPLFFLGLPVTATLMVAEWGFGANGMGWYGWLAFSLALPVQVGLGVPFCRNAWRQLFRNRLTMDTLVAVGSTAAFGLSLYALAQFVAGGSAGHLHVWFLESSAILTLVGAGHWLEGRLAARTGQALRDLLRSVPATVLRLGQGQGQSHDQAHEVPLASLAKGDLILVRPGDRIPVDGEIVEGHGAIDESLLTGESLPVEKGPGFPVRAGTFNADGRLVVRVDGLGAETALAGIVRAVERAQSSRAEIERLVDRVSRHFVLAVITLAMLAFFGWGFLSDIGWEASLLRAVAVLVVACPCAMGLATPAALMAAANAASRRGILFRDAIAIEKTGKIDTVLFDKTGTLTGDLAVSGIEHAPIAPAGGEGKAAPLPREVFAALVRALAAPSQHPLCRALVLRFPTAAPLVVEGWREERGAGVTGRWQGRTVRLGSPGWLIASGIVFPDAFLPRLGGGALGLAVGEEAAALISFVKPVKPEAAAVIRELGKRGYEIYMVTGDAEVPAHAVATELGIKTTKVFAGVRPEEKADIVIRLRAEGEGRKERRVAFVGDGINDGPALAAADLGIAVLGASDVAREASDIVLLTRDLEAVPEALRLSAATRAVIRQNLFWAFVYNAGMVPLALFGAVPPVACALAMGLSDLCVMGNAMRLLRYGAAKPKEREIRS